MFLSRMLQVSASCIFLILFTLGPSPLRADSFLLIDGKVPTERHSFFREKIPMLKDLSFDQVRYADYRVLGISLVRIEDQRYCNNDLCVNYVVLDQSGDHLGVLATRKVWLHTIPVSLGPDANRTRKEAMGSMISFETSVPQRPTIRVFVGSDALVIIP